MDINQEVIKDIANSLYKTIEHGDEEHREWLLNKSYEWANQYFKNYINEKDNSC